MVDGGGRGVLVLVCVGWVGLRSGWAEICVMSGVGARVVNTWEGGACIPLVCLLLPAGFYHDAVYWFCKQAPPHSNTTWPTPSLTPLPLPLVPPAPCPYPSTPHPTPALAHVHPSPAPCPYPPFLLYPCIRSCWWSLSPGAPLTASPRASARTASAAHSLADESSYSDRYLDRSTRTLTGLQRSNLRFDFDGMASNP